MSWSKLISLFGMPFLLLKIATQPFCPEKKMIFRDEFVCFNLNYCHELLLWFWCNVSHTFVSVNFCQEFRQTANSLYVLSQFHRPHILTLQEIEQRATNRKTAVPSQFFIYLLHQVITNERRAFHITYIRTANFKSSHPFHKLHLSCCWISIKERHISQPVAFLIEINI